MKRQSQTGYLVEAGFQVQHANPLCPPKLHPVPPCIVELVLVLGHPFIDQGQYSGTLGRAAQTRCLGLGAAWA